MTIQINIRKVIAVAIAVVAVFGFIWVVDAYAAPYPTGVGGTGTSQTPASGTIPIGNGAGSYTPAFLTPGANIQITNGSGTVTIAVTGTATGTVYLLNGGHGISLSPGSITTSGTIAVNTSTVIADVVASGQFLASSTTYVVSVNGQSGAVTLGIPATTTINSTQATVFKLIGDGTTVTSTVNGTTTTFSIINTGNWAGTWQGVNSTTFYLASNPNGYISTSTFNATGTANYFPFWNGGTTLSPTSSIYQSGTNIGIGNTTNPDAPLNVVSFPLPTSTLNTPTVDITENFSSTVVAGSPIGFEAFRENVVGTLPNVGGNFFDFQNNGVTRISFGGNSGNSNLAFLRHGTSTYYTFITGASNRDDMEIYTPVNSNNPFTIQPNGDIGIATSGDCGVLCVGNNLFTVTSAGVVAMGGVNNGPTWAANGNLNNENAAITNVSTLGVNSTTLIAGKLSVGTSTTPTYTIDVGSTNAQTARFQDSTSTRVVIKNGASDGVSSPILAFDNTSGLAYMTMGVDNGGNGGELNIDNNAQSPRVQVIGTGITNNGLVMGTQNGSTGVFWTSGDVNAAKDTALTRYATNTLAVGGSGNQGDYTGTLIAGKIGLAQPTPQNLVDAATGTIDIELDNPTSTPTLVQSSAQGSLPTSTVFYFECAASDGTGQTLPTSEVSTSSPSTATSSIIVTCPQIKNAGYNRVYFATSTGAEAKYFLTDTTAYTFATTTGALAGSTSTVDTAYGVKFSSNGSSWITDTSTPGLNIGNDYAGSIRFGGVTLSRGVSVNNPLVISGAVGLQVSSGVIVGNNFQGGVGLPPNSTISFSAGSTGDTGQFQGTSGNNAAGGGATLLAGDGSGLNNRGGNVIIQSGQNAGTGTDSISFIVGNTSTTSTSTLTGTSTAMTINASGTQINSNNLTDANGNKYTTSTSKTIYDIAPATTDYPSFLINAPGALTIKNVDCFNDNAPGNTFTFNIVVSSTVTTGLTYSSSSLLFTNNQTCTATSTVSTFTSFANASVSAGQSVWLWITSASSTAAHVQIDY